MIEIEVLNARLSGTSLSSSSSSRFASGPDTYCVLRDCSGREIDRTDVCYQSFEPIWSRKIVSSYFELNSKEQVNNRPFFLESLLVEVYDVSQLKHINGAIKDKTDKTKTVGVKLYETRVPIWNAGLFKSYRLLKTAAADNSSDSQPQLDESRVFIRINRVKDVIYDCILDFAYYEMSAVYPCSSPAYRHLYLDFEWSPHSFTYTGGLPGPICGELVMDVYRDVEWRVAAGCNSFGDKLQVRCIGSLIVTDLRLIYLPSEVVGPLWTHVVASGPPDLTPELILSLQRYTMQVPLSSIVDCKSYSDGGSARTWVLHVEMIDGCSVEFFVRRGGSVKPVPCSSSSGEGRSQDEIGLGDSCHAEVVQAIAAKLSSSPSCYKYGLATAEVDPQTWCERVVDLMQWEMQLDNVWIRWTKYMKGTCLKMRSMQDPSWVQGARKRVDLHREYQRLRVHDGDWQLNSLNSSYSLCPTYPSLLVLPKCLEDDDIRRAANERSIGRLPSLVWLHPFLKAPLCRAAQPLAGMKGTSIEADKKLLVAIKSSSLTGLPLRIADARPKLNANANAVQGKGFESMSFLGGSSVASIAFLDIENIHVMRSSIQKLRDSGSTGSSGGAGSDGSATVGSGGTGTGSGGSNGWLNHIMAVLKGAVAVADSLFLGHPVLVHCSDGWDRTSQLTALSQLMLDPYYRTIDGFIVLVYKEWISFGHKFEDRLGKTKHKETSPVFLQFLDAAYQLLRQSPADFEFSAAFITTLSQIALSGYFISFRRNSERERTQWMRAVGAYEDVSIDDFDYSTFSLYLHLLLRTSNYATILVNDSYAPPIAAKKLVHYVRPRCNKHDLELWRDGLCGMNNNLLLISSLTAPSITSNEAHWMGVDRRIRALGCVELHHRQLPPQLSTMLSLIQCAPYPLHCPHASVRGRCYPSHSIAAVESDRGTAAGAMDGVSAILTYYANTHLSSRSIFDALPLQLTSLMFDSMESQHGRYGESYPKSHDGYRRAVELGVRLQLWCRAVVAATRAAIELTTSCTHSARRRVYKSLLVIASSYVKSKARLRWAITQANERFVRSLVDEVVEDTLLKCFRDEVYSRTIDLSFVEWDCVSNDGPNGSYRYSAPRDASPTPASRSPSKSSHSPMQQQSGSKSLKSRLFGFGSSKDSREKSSSVDELSSSLDNGDAVSSVAAVSAAASAEGATSPSGTGLWFRKKS